MSNTLTAVETFHEVVNKVISQAIKNGTHSSDQVLLLLTQTDSNSGYGYDEDDISYPHTTDRQLIMPFGTNEQGQDQYLISFDPISCDDPTHPDPSVPAGWDWKSFNQPETEPESKQKKINPIILVLTRRKQEDGTERVEPGKPGEIQGFTLAKMPDIENHEQFVIMVDPTVFTVQIQSS